MVDDVPVSVRILVGVIHFQEFLDVSGIDQEFVKFGTRLEGSNFKFDAKDVIELIEALDKIRLDTNVAVAQSLDDSLCEMLLDVQLVLRKVLIAVRDQNL